MTNPIDYSRPVGWWCRRTCHDYTLEEGGPPCNACIPRYLPIPEGQRPPAAGEVEEAEIATGSLRDDSPCCWVTIDAVYAPDNGWLAAIVHLAEYADADHINDIANESAHIVTGVTE